jgi:hypothetical protein
MRHENRHSLGSNCLEKKIPMEGEGNESGRRLCFRLIVLKSVSRAAPGDLQLTSSNAGSDNERMADNRDSVADRGELHTPVWGSSRLYMFGPMMQRLAVPQDFEKEGSARPERSTLLLALKHHNSKALRLVWARADNP